MDEHFYLDPSPFSMMKGELKTGWQKEISSSSQDSLTTLISKEVSKIPHGDLELLRDCHHLVYSDNSESDDQETSEPPTSVPKVKFFQLVGNKFKALGERSRRPISFDSGSSDAISSSTPSTSGTHDNSGSRVKPRKFRFFRRQKNLVEPNCIEVEFGGLSDLFKINSKLVSQVECPPTQGDFLFRYAVDEDDFVIVDHAPMEFSLSIPYESIQKGNIIGQGAFGEVYEGQWQGKKVAMKVVAGHHYTCPTGAAFIDSLKKELTVLKSVGMHENVVKCYGGSLNKSNIFVLSELMERSLSDLIYGGRNSHGIGKLPPSLALQITRDVLSGLSHLHNMNPPIVHRDIKPDNILLDPQNKALVTDFGLSRTKAGSYLHTAHGHAGTPAYLAPEVLKGRIGEKMDVYAVGVVLWECLTGIRPWHGYHPLGILLAVAEGKRLDFPTEIFPEDKTHYMHKIRMLIESCWHGDHRERPACTELVKEIDRLRTNNPVLQLPFQGTS